MRLTRVSLAVAAVAALSVATAQAAPITYLGNLEPGVPVLGVNMQPAGDPTNPLGADYWSFFAEAGNPITVFGDRLSGHYDMSFVILSGLYTDTNQFGGALPGLQVANLIDFGDDDDPPNIPGPFGDPRSVFNAPVTGFYTIAVTNFVSTEAPPNPYQLTALGVSSSTTVPEPTSMLLLGSGLAGIAGAMRRRRKQQKTQA